MPKENSNVGTFKYNLWQLIKSTFMWTRSNIHRLSCTCKHQVLSLYIKKKNSGLTKKGIEDQAIDREGEISVNLGLLYIHHYTSSF